MCSLLGATSFSLLVGSINCEFSFLIFFSKFKAKRIDLGLTGGRLEIWILHTQIRNA